MKRAPQYTFALVLCFGLAFTIAACGGGGGGTSGSSGTQPEATIPATGPTSAYTPKIDAQMTALMKQWNIPGMTLAISKNGRLIVARGYGYADRDAKVQMQPDTRGRIGSISKTMTSVALLQLVEEGKLDLDTPFLDVLTDFPLPAYGDPRMRTVTVRQIMRHTGGWQTSVSGDVEVMTRQIAVTLNVPEPTGCGDWIRYKLRLPLDFDPGSKYSYSNFGYCVMSQVVEHITGQNYYDYVKQHVLLPMSIRGMATAYTLESQLQPRETHYYDYPGASNIPSVFPPHDYVPAPYGWAQMEALKGMGGWVASAIDLARFMNHVDGSAGAQLLQQASIDQFLANPLIPGHETDSSWYGLGIGVEDVPTGMSQITPGVYWFHSGGCPGTVAYLERTPDGYDWAVVLNSSPQLASNLVGQIAQATHVLLYNGLSDSGTDLYGQFPSNP